MGIHKEGFGILTGLYVILLISNICLFLWCPYLAINYLFLAGSLFLVVFITRFFRSPKRVPVISENEVISPADGQIVNIEEVVENEYFKDKRMLVSIFMSAHNVHVNWYPIGGIISYFRYHPGKYLVARLPKSSEKNERTSIVIRNNKGQEILLRQIAGYVARRIVSYAAEGSEVSQCGQLGFIKFGSRIDLFLPMNTKIKVTLHQKVTGTQTVIAEIS
ncbi:MAG: phosphatidylserine decarboxylase family protein [Bacteroidia bacterium]|nr:phosphatidylserine decarboxylase family protein [Bacteroidia bacterium]